ncbi:MAG: Gfo/Idh/MocA family oxidoreductase [Porticoccaceae bacterium]|nr:Gfo/Idh/MocA family oxidoreductase [Porticoccaceae bacterium]
MMILQDTVKSTPIHWGIMGAGRIARTFAHDIQFAKSASLYGVASREQSKAQSFAADFSIPVFYSSYEAILKDPKVDAVYIATPHSHHKNHAIAALRAGKHVLCEKPVVVNPQELEDVITVAQETGKYFMEGMWTYFMPVIQTVSHWVNQGRIGQLHHVKADFGFPLAYSSELREYNNKLAGGCLLEMGIYPIAMAWLFLGQDPDQQTVWHHKAPNGVEDDVVVLNIFDAPSATAQLTTSFRSKLNNNLTLIGDQGTIFVQDYWAAREAKLYRHNQCIDRCEEVREHQGFNHQIEQVSCDIKAGKTESSVVTWNDSRAFQRHIQKIKTHF